MHLFAFTNKLQIASRNEIKKENRFLRKNLLRVGRIVLKPIEKLIFRMSTEIIITARKILEIEEYASIRHKTHYIPFGANTDLFRPENKQESRTMINRSNA